MSNVLVVNSGSSSLKYQIFDMETGESIAKGLVDRVGTAHGTISHESRDSRNEREAKVLDHTLAFEAMVDACNEWGPDLDEARIEAVGHRVVQGGSRFIQPTIIDDAVTRTIDELSALAPLHNPPNLLGIEAAWKTFPDVPHVAVFDTAFHQTMPEVAHTYAIDANLAQQYRIRRYGFHGTSHRYVAQLAAEHLGIPFDAFNAITLHIGNGVSACAIRGGKSVDTSMGMTPLEGLVMGTRSGDIDPGILFHLHRQAGMTIDQLDDLLNRRSGMLGLAGSSDLRDVQEAADRGDRRASLALDIYCRRLRHTIGAYLVDLDPLHAIVFTAGVGENSAVVRSKVLEGLDRLGIAVDPAHNEANERGTRRVSTDDSPIAVLVVPTNEELEIARQTLTATAIS
jgi:acetate kinase